MNEELVPEQPKAAITIEEFDGLIKKLADFRKTLDDRKIETSKINEEAEKLEGKLMSALGEMGRSSYKSEYGTISIMNKWRINLPASQEDKEALKQYLQEQGAYDGLATYNSNSLNSYYMQAWEAAKEKGEGMDFKIPGVGDPKLHKALSFRKG